MVSFENCLIFIYCSVCRSSIISEIWHFYLEININRWHGKFDKFTLAITIVHTEFNFENIAMLSKVCCVGYCMHFDNLICCLLIAKMKRSIVSNDSMLIWKHCCDDVMISCFSFSSLFNPAK